MTEMLSSVGGGDRSSQLQVSPMLVSPLDGELVKCGKERLDGRLNDTSISISSPDPRLSTKSPSRPLRKRQSYLVTMKPTDAESPEPFSPSPTLRKDDNTSIKKRRTMEEGQVVRKTVHRAKDELEFATNWRRVFISIYQQMKWLNAFAQINLLAVQRI